jgi:hypothetical protein
MFLVGILLPDLIRIIQEYLLNQMMESGMNIQIRDAAPVFIGSYTPKSYMRLIFQQCVQVNGSMPPFTYGFWLSRPSRISVRYGENELTFSSELKEGYHPITDLVFPKCRYKDIIEMHDTHHNGRICDTVLDRAGKALSIHVMQCGIYIRKHSAIHKWAYHDFIARPA